MKRTVYLLFGWTLLTFVWSPSFCEAQVALTNSDLLGAWKSVSYSRRTSVHDPSVVVDTFTNPAQQTFYIFGTHMGVSRTTDLVNWTSNITGGQSTSATLFGRRNADGTVGKCSYNAAFTTHEVDSVEVLLNDSVRRVPFGSYNTAAWQTAVDNSTTAGNMWAPDVIYNPVMGKWLYYLSLNGMKWNSAIICMAADKVTGPYVYQGPVVFCGFDVQADSPSYKDSDLELVLGEQSALPSRYKRGNSWGSYWPHTIDPCVFFDEEGQFWMSYGSWSGGIYLLRLNPKNGLRDYTITYPAQNATSKNVASDPYFGLKIAGGYYVSGEGSYIHRIGDFYYLFVTYGGLTSNGGYEMRVFRSRKVEGPYKDCSTATGTSAIYSSYQMNYGPNAATSRGLKLLGSYQWDNMPVAEVAQGHNSVCTDRQGRVFVIYHTRFNNGNEGFEERVHQLFVNEEGWLCAAPYEFAGEKVTQDSLSGRQAYTPEEIAGTYQLLRHPYKTDYENYAYSKPQNIELHADGTVTGLYKGTWRLTEGTSFITLQLNYVTYKGVLVSQTIDYTNIPALCFTAVSSGSGTAGVTRAVEVWGSKAPPKAAIKQTIDYLKVPFYSGSKVKSDLALPTQSRLGATVEWLSSRPDLLSHTGELLNDSANATLSLTLSVSKDGYCYQRVYSLRLGEGDTAVRPIEDEATPDVYYDLSGRRVLEPRHGLYLYRGRKVWME